MTYEEVKRVLLPFIDKEAYTDEYQDACNLVLQAFAKQIPQKPMIDADYEIYTCPVCGGFLAYVVDAQDEHYQDNYCAGCGQAILWE